MKKEEQSLFHLQLPYANNLPIEKLAAVFNNTTNSYKYYWFLAMLETIKKNNVEPIPMKDIIIEMISEVWYPINYFKLSFGKQDQLTKVIKDFLDYLDYPKDLKKQELKERLIREKNNIILKGLIIEISRYVPYRFLTPFFSKELRGIPDYQKNAAIIQLAADHFSDSKITGLYEFTKN